MSGTIVFHICKNCNILLTRVYDFYESYDEVKLTKEGWLINSSSSEPTPVNSVCPSCDKELNFNDPIELPFSIVDEILSMQDAALQKAITNTKEIIRWQGGVPLESKELLNILMEHLL